MPGLVPITRDNVDQVGQIAAFEAGNVCTAAFGPDGNLLASSGNHELRLWDALNRTTIRTLSVDNREVWRIAFSSDSGHVAATSTGNSCGDTRVSVWNMEDGELLLQRLEDYDHMATDVAFSPDGRLLAAGASCPMGQRGVSYVKVWDLASGDLVLDMPASSFVSDLAFSPDGRLLAAAVVDGVWLWDVVTGEVYAELHGNRGDMRSIAFSPDGAYLASAGGLEIILWDVASREQLYQLAEAGAQLAFSADGQILVTGERVLNFHDALTGEVLASSVPGSENDYIYSLSFNADNTLLAICTHGTMLYLWGVER